MEWTSEGIICSVARHGESGAVVRVITQDHGLHAGFVPGGMGKRLRASLEPGNTVSVRWRARLSDHLGTMQIEVSKVRAAAMMASPIRLAALASLTSLVVSTLPERQAMPDLMEAFTVALDLICSPDVPLEAIGATMVRFEIGLLTVLGFGLDLTRCAGTGRADNLIYVSPKTGRAVSAEAGAPYKERLLELPAFLLGSQAGSADVVSLRQGFRLSGYFLDTWVAGPKNAALPSARDRFIQSLLKALAQTPREWRQA